MYFSKDSLLKELSSATREIPAIQHLKVLTKYWTSSSICIQIPCMKTNKKSVSFDAKLNEVFPDVEWQENVSKTT